MTIELALGYRANRKHLPVVQQAVQPGGTRRLRIGRRQGNSRRKITVDEGNMAAIIALHNPSVKSTCQVEISFSYIELHDFFNAI